MKLLSITIGLIVTVIGSTSFVSNASAEADSLPEWIKNVAGFWAEGQTTDTDFVNAIEFLIDEGIIEVSYSQNLVGRRA